MDLSTKWIGESRQAPQIQTSQSSLYRRWARSCGMSIQLRALQLQYPEDGISEAFAIEEASWQLLFAFFEAVSKAFHNNERLADDRFNRLNRCADLVSRRVSSRQCKARYEYADKRTPQFRRRAIIKPQRFRFMPCAHSHRVADIGYSAIVSIHHRQLGNDVVQRQLLDDLNHDGHSSDTVFLLRR